MLATGSILPFLRASGRQGTVLDLTKIDTNKTDGPLNILYSPTWPDNVPELRVGETLALPKFGLPQVRGQKSVDVIYQQSIANGTKSSSSVTLHDPTRQKTYEMGGSDLPSALKTTSYQGKTYFQGLPPSLQKRLYHDPARGTQGMLVLTGEFHDELTGDDYLDLNLLTAGEKTAILDLLDTNDADYARWQTAIEALSTTVETFLEVSNKAGTYEADSSLSVQVDYQTLPEISDPDTAVDSYAISANGKGSGYVSVVFGNGRAFTPEGDPVQVQVFKVAPQLYVGDLKVIPSSNPLDEQVTLRHSADFAGHPEDYEFDWRWATGADSAPATYLTTMVAKLDGTSSWAVVPDPNALRLADFEYSARGQTASMPVYQNVHPVLHAKDELGQETTTVIDDTTVVLPPLAVNGTTVTVSDTSSLVPGMIVTASSLTGLANVESITDGTTLVLSQAPANSSAALTFHAATYSESDKAAGYPGLLAKAAAGVNFSTGVPGEVIFSANLGSLDGLVVYVNGVAALAHQAPAAFFAASGASLSNSPPLSGLSSSGLGKQFSIDPSYFTAGVNSIEVAVYTTADANSYSTLEFRLEAASETDNVLGGADWQTAADPDGKNTNTAAIGGATTNPFGGPTFVLNDRWFTMRYRPRVNAGNIMATGTDQSAVAWSRWMPPQFVEGWVKRVLSAINPFEQRVKDLYNNQVSTSASIIEQAGKRWEGDVALTLDNINDAGLIEIYETVLNRAKNMSINAGTNDPDSNNALLLAAGYLHDLYTFLGDEAYADAANPTISIDDQAGASEVNSSRFSFENQVASFLDEELALLRGRDDSVSPGVRSAPAYNRLYWNYTGGINSGQAIYAINYNIKERAGSSTANGVIDEYDAQRMYPQGHGDAYGHYLTALTGYYGLLSNDSFTWTPRAEAVTVAGLPVTVDFQDERKFAAAAANVARAAQQICALVFRQEYVDDEAAGWSQFRDQRAMNAQTSEIPHQGLDEWVSRSGQGSFYHWVVANALVPDSDPYHQGVQKIDRSTVPEITELSSLGDSFQSTIDNASAHLNPLGLSPGAVAFDIDPAQSRQGRTHYEQLNDRALQALLNAAGSFNEAARMTRLLRGDQTSLDDYVTGITEQEQAYVYQLIDIYGRPYSGDIGPGKTYAQDYTGPDFVHWFIVDRPTGFAGLVDTSSTVSVTIREPSQIRTYTADEITDIVSGNATTADDNFVTVAASIAPSSPSFALWKAASCHHQGKRRG